uniref:Uncharacterized protein n=1 Tax=Anguilla anguilla TaxID=7936 RepID=A0A0E9PD59_ANGAN
MISNFTQDESRANMYVNTETRRIMPVRIKRF